MLPLYPKKNMTKPKHPAVHEAVGDIAKLAFATLEGTINFFVIGGFALLTHILIAFIIGMVFKIVGLSVVYVTEGLGDIIEGVLDIEQIFVDVINTVITFINNIGDYISDKIKSWF